MAQLIICFSQTKAGIATDRYVVRVSSRLLRSSSSRVLVGAALSAAAVHPLFVPHNFLTVRLPSESFTGSERDPSYETYWIEKKASRSAPSTSPTYAGTAGFPQRADGQRPRPPTVFPSVAAGLAYPELGGTAGHQGVFRSEEIGTGTLGREQPLLTGVSALQAHRVSVAFYSRINPSSVPGHALSTQVTYVVSSETSCVHIC